MPQSVISVYIVTSLRSGRRWFGTHYCARWLSLVQSVLQGYHAMSCIQ